MTLDEIKQHLRDQGVTFFHEEDAGIIINADCLDILPKIPAGAIDLVLTDPPYYRVKNESWDKQWPDGNAFISWIGQLSQCWNNCLKPNGSLYVFASPEMSAQVECEIRKHFNILNRIRWIKENGWHKKADKEELRSFLSPWEEIIFAEQYADQYGEAEKALHKEVYAPLGRYIQLERERAGFTRNQVEVALGYTSTNDPTRGTALCYRWEEGSSLPTKETYLRLRTILNGGDDKKEYLRREYEDLRREYEDLRRPFNAPDKSDVWDFPTVAPYPGKHPCEKPLSMMRYIIEVSTRTNAIILDGFFGSGTTGVAAKELCRPFIGIEKDTYWCRIAVDRIRQGVLAL